MAAIQELVNNLHEVTICGVCQRDDSGSFPRILPCMHTMCECCIRSHMYFSPLQQKSTTFECPVCATRIPIEDKTKLLFPVNTPVKKIYDTLRDYKLNRIKSNSKSLCELCSIGSAEYSCDDCRKDNCDTCRVIHNKISNNHNVNLILPEKKPQMIIDRDFCSEHKNEVVNLYCKVCDEVICRVCRKETHTKPHHKCQDISQKKDEWKVELKSLTSQATVNRKELLSQIDAINRISDEWVANVDDVSKKAAKSKDQVLRAIDDHFGKIQACIKETVTTNKKKIEERKQKLKDHVARIDRWCEVYKNSTEHDVYMRKSGKIKDDVRNLEQLNEQITTIKQDNVDVTKLLFSGSFSGSIPEEIKHINVMVEVTKKVLNKPRGIAVISETFRNTNEGIKIVVVNTSSEIAIYNSRNVDDVKYIQAPPGVKKWKPNCVAVDGGCILVGNGVHCSVGGGLYYYNENGHDYGYAPLKIGYIASVTMNEDLNILYFVRKEVGKPTILCECTDSDYLDNGSLKRLNRSENIFQIGEPQYAAYHHFECFTVISHSTGVIAVREGETVWSYGNRWQTRRKIVSPSGVAIGYGSNADVLVADRATGHVLFLSCNGEYLSEIELPSGPGIEGIAVDGSDNLYVINGITDELHIIQDYKKRMSHY